MYEGNNLTITTILPRGSSWIIVSTGLHDEDIAKRIKEGITQPFAYVVYDEISFLAEGFYLEY